MLVTKAIDQKLITLWLQELAPEINLGDASYHGYPGYYLYKIISF